MCCVGEAEDLLTECYVPATILPPSGSYVLADCTATAGLSVLYLLQVLR